MLKSNTAVVTNGIDPGKNTLHLVGLDARGGIVLREKVARARIVSRLANVPSCLIGIEAGMGTHYVTRELLALGHDVRQVPPVYGCSTRGDGRNRLISRTIRSHVSRCTLAASPQSGRIRMIDGTEADFVFGNSAAAF